MAYNPIDYLGLSCPSGGDFYICQDSKVRFLGCCDINPCGSDECPSSALHPASFNTDKYNLIEKQKCASSNKVAEWYTCGNGSSFLGCCVSDACHNNGVCSKNDLVGARLADDQGFASIFLTPTASTSTSSAISSTPTIASSPTPTTPIPNPAPGSIGQGSSIGGIVGAVLGGLSILGLIAFVFLRYRRRRRKARAIVQPDDDAPQPWSPYHGEATLFVITFQSRNTYVNASLDSFRNSSALPPAPVSPLTAASTRPLSLSASLSSLIGLKRTSGSKSRSSQTFDNRESSTPDYGQSSPGLLNPIAELENLQPRRPADPGRLQNSVHYEVEGSIPNVGYRPTAS
ncbi:hypothetical protein NUW58_g2911 [Xylaria curta]|uniref:Uncharacterized protein n=1 Tax=Xylaria curta TaxID=42375 RepID=A0ACC1PF57_9PEZI|nr:hypothetical protein NUW58_g2911 [Xylaria curta]